MRKPFWQSCSVFWRFKTLLLTIVLGSILSAVSFGAGLGMLFPVAQLLLNPEQSLKEQLARPEPEPQPQSLPQSATGDATSVGELTQEAGPFDRLREAVSEQASSLADAAISALPSDPFWQFVCILGVLVVLTMVGSFGRYHQSAGTQTLTIYAEQWWRTRLLRRAIRVPLAQLHADAGAATKASVSPKRERRLERERRKAAKNDASLSSEDRAQLALERHGPQGGSSDLIARMTNDVTQMCLGYPVLLARGLESVLQGIAGLVVAFVLNWQLAAMAMVMAPLLGFIIASFGSRIRRATRSELGYRGSLLLTLTQAFGSLATVKASNAEGTERRRFHHIQRRILDERLRVRKIKALSSPLMDTLSLIAVVSVTAVAAWWVFRLGVPPGELVVVLGALVAAGGKLKPLTNLNNELQAAGAAADRVMTLLEHLPAEPSDIEGRRGLPAAPLCEKGVRFESIVHRYRGADRNAVDDVTIDVPAGARVAIVGGNGSGKTTLVNHLPRLLTPTSGRVLIDGVDIAGVNLKSLRERVAVVSQKTALFAGTIHENIAYGRLASTREEVIAAAKHAFADEFIATLPDGYDTRLGEGGTGLSGGQSQRISIARAVLRDAPILILDEATSQVDADSEAKIKLAIDRLTQGRTTLLIAHRLSTVVDADRIVVMENGRILASGKHADLMKESAVYRRLVEAQLIPAAAEPAEGEPTDSQHTAAEHTGPEPADSQPAAAERTEVKTGTPQA